MSSPISLSVTLLVLQNLAFSLALGSSFRTRAPLFWQKGSGMWMTFGLGVKCKGTKLTAKLITVLILHKQAFWKSLEVQGNNVSD